jgi:REP element-mobilizing transposase RayT
VQISIIGFTRYNTTVEHRRLKRLERIWLETPVFFVTACTHRRKPILANDQITEILVEEWLGALERHGWAIGRYVVMPDHVHFFCAPVGGIASASVDGIASASVGGIDDPAYRVKTLSDFMQQWKQWTSKRIIREWCAGDPLELRSPIWQAGFFDHLLRSQESPSQKWEYVRYNPVRAGLVEKPEDWIWQGEVFEL